jgi:ubiquinone/menaquinone biosynthesis C-methylase UbiE
MKISYVRGLEEEGAKFWLSRVGRNQSEASEKIPQENDPENTGYVADIGGGHGHDALWLAQHRFHTILIERKRYSLMFARERAKDRRLDVCLINAMLPYLPMRSEANDVADLFWALH